MSRYSNPQPKRPGCPPEVPHEAKAEIALRLNRLFVEKKNQFPTMDTLTKATSFESAAIQGVFSSSNANAPRTYGQAPLFEILVNLGVKDPHKWLKDVIAYVRAPDYTPPTEEDIRIVVGARNHTGVPKIAKAEIAFRLNKLLLEMSDTFPNLTALVASSSYDATAVSNMFAASNARSPGIYTKDALMEVLGDLGVKNPHKWLEDVITYVQAPDYTPPTEENIREVVSKRGRSNTADSVPPFAKPLIAERIRLKMENSPLSRGEIMNQSGVSSYTLSSIMRERQPQSYSRDSLVKVLTCLGVKSPDDWIDGVIKQACADCGHARQALASRESTTRESRPRNNTR